MESRGIRNHNPGNVRKGDPWQGLDTPADDGAFCRFINPAYGIRAIARILITYQDKHGINTLQDIISRWAPSNENDVGSYLHHVCIRTGIEALEPINIHQFHIAKDIVESIILHENGGQPYSDSQIEKGLILAGIEPPMKLAIASRTVQGVAVAGGSGTLAVVTEYSNQAGDLIDNLQGYEPWILGAVFAIALGWILYARWDDRRRGLR